jgi:hypothetical protein
VTPLWAAAVSGRLAVVKTLLRHGADVDAISDSGSTPVRWKSCQLLFFVITNLWPNKLERFENSNIFLAILFFLERLAPIQGPVL